MCRVWRDEVPTTGVQSAAATVDEFKEQFGTLLSPWAQLRALFDQHPHLCTYAGEEHKTLVLHPAGIAGEGVQVCDICVCSLRRARTPPRSLANGLWTGINCRPPELTDLKLPEQALIALHRVRLHLVRLGQKWHQEKPLALRGHVCTLPQDPGPAVRRLPRDPEELADTIHVVFVGSKMPTPEVLAHYTEVRRRRVRDAIEWLHINNPLWKHVTIDESVLERLPYHGVPSQLTPQQIESVELEHLLAADRSTYAAGGLLVTTKLHISTCLFVASEL